MLVFNINCTSASTIAYGIVKEHDMTPRDWIGLPRDVWLWHARLEHSSQFSSWFAMIFRES